MSLPPSSGSCQGLPRDRPTRGVRTKRYDHMRRTINRSLGLGTAALLAATALGAQPGSASGPTGSTAQASPAGRRQPPSTAHSTAPTGPPGPPSAGSRRTRKAALADQGPEVRARDAVLDRSGATHVRLDRTYRGLRVIGGDLVVHQAGGPLARRQPDADQADPALDHAEARRGARPPRRRSRSPPPPARSPKLRAAGTAAPGRRDPLRQAPPRLAGHLGRQARRPDAQPAVDVRRRPLAARSCAARSTS